MRGSGEKLVRIALVGNPNSGKSTIFNQLTGLRQKTGNFPGVTVDIKEGRLRFPGGREAMLTDLPGTYSLYPTSSDEKIVAAVLANRLDTHFPDAVIYVADATHLEKHLLLLTQLLDLDLPVLLALNMSDTAAEIGIRVNATKLAERLGIPVVAISGRTGENISKLISETEKLISGNSDRAHKRFYPLSDVEKHVTEAVCLNLGLEKPIPGAARCPPSRLAPVFVGATPQYDRGDRARQRFCLPAGPSGRNTGSIRPLHPDCPGCRTASAPISQHAHRPHRRCRHTPGFRSPALFCGDATRLSVDLRLEYSADGFDRIFFFNLNIWLKALLPAHWLTDLLTDGILAGLAGILVFVPQIAILFLLVITLLEESRLYGPGGIHV
jgi:ferrous iron transport protein B